MAGHNLRVPPHPPAGTLTGPRRGLVSVASRLVPVVAPPPPRPVVIGSRQRQTHNGGSTMTAISGVRAPISEVR